MKSLNELLWDKEELKDVLEKENQENISVLHMGCSSVVTMGVSCGGGGGLGDDGISMPGPGNRYRD